MLFLVEEERPMHCKRWLLLLTTVFSLFLLSSVAYAKTTLTTTLADEPLKLKANDNYVYAELDKKSVIIALYIGKDKNPDLNNAVPGKTVVAIESKAFLPYKSEYAEKNDLYTVKKVQYKNSTKINSIILPEGLKEIGYMAFRGNNLKEVAFPSTLEYVDYKAFADNPFEIIPYIPDTAKVNSPFGNEMPDTVTFSSEYTTIPNSFLTFGTMKKLIVPDGVTSIGDQAFYGCKMTEFVFPASLEEVGSRIFENCDSLSKFTLPANFHQIPDRMLYGCKGLTSVTIPAGVTSIGKYAFYGCINLTRVTLPSSLLTIDDYAFTDCAALSGISLPPRLTSIGEAVFKGCGNLKSFNLPGT